MLKKLYVSSILVILYASLSYADKCVEGDCENGYGTVNFDSGSYYIGEFKNNTYDGYGTFYDANEDIRFTGKYMGGSELEGELFYHRSGNKYTGQFKFMSIPRAQFHGFGRYYWGNNQDEYVGEWKDGQPHGYGTLTLVSEDQVYSGEWINGKRKGEGITINIEIFTGGFRDNMIDIYVGGYSNDKKNGKGIIYSPSGRIIDSGIFKDGIGPNQ